MNYNRSFEKLLSVFKKEIRINSRAVVSFLIVFSLQLFVYSVLQNLCIPDIETFITGLRTSVFFFLTLSSVGIICFILHRTHEKKAIYASGRFHKAAVAFCLCICAAFWLDATFFQYHHYGHLWAGQEISSESPQTEWGTYRFGQIYSEDGLSNIVSVYTSLVDITKDRDSETIDQIDQHLTLPVNSIDDTIRSNLADYKAAISNGETMVPEPVSFDSDMAVVQFSNVNTPISSIHISPVFYQKGNLLAESGTHNMKIIVGYGDEDNTFYVTDSHYIIENQPWTEYIPLHTVGNASTIYVCFVGQGTGFTDITLNSMIPLDPVIGRILLVAAILFCFFLLKQRMFDPFSVTFQQDNRFQQAGFCVLLAVLFAYCLSLAMNTIQFDYEPYSAGQYNHYLVDSILNGRLDLDIPTSPEFASLERPYDVSSYRILGIDYLSEKLHWDTVYFQGKWYTYFGIVPALIFFVPYTLITGEYLPYAAACFIMGCLSILFLLLTWRKFFSRNLSHLPYSVFLLSSAALALCSFVPFLVHRSFFYETANLGGLMFCSAGLLLLSQYRNSETAHPRAALFGSCLCFALAVGCRPTMLLSSALVPLFLLPDLKQMWIEKKLNLPLLLCVAIPYILVAVPLMWYNDARFGSPFDFGSTYQVTGLNLSVQNLLSPVARLQRFVEGVAAYLLNPPETSILFPFFTVNSVQLPDGVHTAQYLGAIGLLSIPTSLFFLGLFRTNSRKSAPAVLWFSAVSLLICFVTAGISATYCIQPQYKIDYA